MQNAFAICKALKTVSFQERSKLKKIGWICFFGNAFNEIAISKTLKTMNTNVFDECLKLEVIHIDNSYKCCFPMQIFQVLKELSLRKIKLFETRLSWT